MVFQPTGIAVMGPLKKGKAMYFKDFAVRIVKDPDIFGCRPERSYPVIAMTAAPPRSGEMLKGYPVPPQQTHVLIKNEENRLKWLSIDRVEVAYNSYVRDRLTADLRTKGYIEELRKAREQEKKQRR
jgi:hypothetical protein